MVDIVYKRKNGTLGQSIRFHDKDGKPVDDPALLTRQEFKDECDINVIIDRFRKSGVAPVASVTGTFGDFSQVTDYQDAMIKIQEAEDYFDSLPAKTRAYFENEPANLVDALDDPTQAEKLVEFGILERKDVLGGTTTPVSEEVKDGV